MESSRGGLRAVAAWWRQWLGALMCVLAAGVCHAAPLVLERIVPDEPLGGGLPYLVDPSGRLELPAVQAAFEAGAGRTVPGSILSLGMGSSTVWIRVSIDNPSPQPHLRRLTVENAWLDRVELHFVDARQAVATYRGGDAQPFAERVRPERFFAVDHSFPPGVTDIFVRVVTDDPLIVPLFLREPELAEQAARDQGYRYGFLYGYLIALAAYNLLIYFSIRDRRYLLYAAFLIAFIGMNAAYTGHGMMWLWPEAPGFQRWIIPVCMMAFGLTGLLFARRFLDTRRLLPWLDRALAWSAHAFAAAFMLAVLSSASPLGALRVAFAFSLFFAMAMVTLGVCGARARVPSAPYFLLASVASALGAAMTALTVWGVVGFQSWAFHAVEAGMVVDATLLGIALGGQFRAVVLERMRAELASRELSTLNQQLNESVEKLAQVAATDGLTGLSNRRHFETQLAAELERSGRYGHPLSLLLFDIDHFKSINDTCGHQVGDAVLCELARVVRGRVRRSDLVTRWGGEEFTVLIPGIALDGARDVGEKLRLAVEAHAFPSGLKVTVSVGVAQWAGVGEPADRWIARADHALYEAKRGGRNRVVVESSPHMVGGHGAAVNYPRLRWSSRYEVGDPRVDAQHRRLFDHANKILRLAAPEAEMPGEGRAPGSRPLLAAVDALLADVAEHCATEEAVLAERGAPGLDMHRHEHALLLSRARALRDGLARTPPLCTVAAVVDYVCVELVANHVLRFDRQAFAAPVPVGATRDGGAVT